MLTFVVMIPIYFNNVGEDSRKKNGIWFKTFKLSGLWN